MDQALAQFVVAGLKNGSIYALLALGFTIVFASTGAINFAQGEFYMLGGMLGVWFTSLGLPLPVAALLAIVATALVGVLLDVLAIRPMGDANPLRIIIVTIGASLVLSQVALHLFGPDERPLAPFSPGPSLRFLGAAIERQTVWIWLLMLGSVVALAFLYRRTAFGRAMRATSLQRDAARLSGVDVRLMVSASFALAGALGALAGLAVAPLTQTAFSVGPGISVKGFSAAILGGLGNPVAAVGGGLILGVLESLTAGYINPTYKDAVALVVLLLVLFVRPQGLFGARRKEKS